jgi:hypothetical protein
MHKVDERVDLSDLAALTAIYHAFLNLFFGRSLSRNTAPTGVSAAAGHRVEPGDGCD